MPPVVGRRDGPQVLGAGQRRGPVLCRDAEDLLPPLREGPEHGRRATVGAHDEVADAELADGPEAVGREHGLVDRLRAAAHVGQRRDLDHAALEVRGDALRIHHVVQRVEQRAQVRVDLGHEVAGQEAEPLAGLDRGAGEDDPVDLAARERGGGHGHGQERLARARGPDAEGDGGAADGVDVALLVDRLRGHLDVAVAPDDVLQHLAGGLGLVQHAGRPTRSSPGRSRARARPGRTARARPWPPPARPRPRRRA